MPGPRTVPVPLCVLGGDDDDDVSEQRLTAWRAAAGAGFALERFHGGHFYLHEDPEPVLACIARFLQG